MRPLTEVQRRAVFECEAAGDNGLTPRNGYTTATIGVLYRRGWVDYVEPTNPTIRWQVVITKGGKAWCARNRTSPDQEMARLQENENRREYRRLAAMYAEDALRVLDKISNQGYTVRKAIEALKAVKSPAISPTQVEAIGWWLMDNNYSGVAYNIGTALCEIGVNCNYRAYPITHREMERLHDFMQTLADDMNALGMIEASDKEDK